MPRTVIASKRPRPSEIRYLSFPTAVGPMGIAWRDDRIVAVQLPERTARATLDRLRTRLPHAAPATLDGAPAWLRRTVATLGHHLEGAPQDLASVPLDLDGLAPFRRRVYEAARTVPHGRTISYAELARRVGSPAAFRAVGSAMRTNPFPLLVPCHRVVASGGKAGGFTAYGGLATKARLLALEGAAPSAPPPPPVHADAVRALAAADRTLAKLITRVGPCRLEQKTSSTTFQVLLEAIVHQQLTGKAAATILGRVRALFPKQLPTPVRLLALPDEKLRGAGLSRAKTAALRDLATRALAGEVPDFAALAKLDDDAIVEKLTAVRGIGRWTVEMLLMFRLDRTDVLPATDYGVRKGFALTFNRKRDAPLPSPADLLAYGERWRPYRSIASWYMWRAVEEAAKSTSASRPIG